MAALADIGTLITSTPEIRGGRARIAGTGVTVMRVVGWHKMGHSPEEIVDQYGHLTLAQVHAALAYYHANRDEIDTDLAEEAAEAARLERQHLAARNRS
jgi:uncharacterized protein (DUF433 family)